MKNPGTDPSTASPLWYTLARRDAATSTTLAVASTVPAGAGRERGTERRVATVAVSQFSLPPAAAAFTTATGACVWKNIAAQRPRGDPTYATCERERPFPRFAAGGDALRDCVVRRPPKTLARKSKGKSTPRDVSLKPQHVLGEGPTSGTSATGKRLRRALSACVCSCVLVTAVVMSLNRCRNAVGNEHAGLSVQLSWM
jgi:hypothetical protein